MTDTGADAHVLAIACAAFALAILVNFAASYVQETVVGNTAEDVLFDMRRAMFAHLQRVSLSFMDKTETGRLMSRLQGDVNSMQEFLETSVLSVGDIALLFGIVFVMLLLDWQLALLTLSVMPILFFVRLIWLPRARAAFMGAHEAASVANGALAEGINGVRAVQGMDRQRVNFTLYDDKARANLEAHLTAARHAQVMVPIVDTLTGIAMAVVIVVGGQRVLGGALDVGVMVAFLFYIQRFFDPIRSLTMQYSVMQRAMASGHRITEVLDVAVGVEDRPGAVALERRHRRLGRVPRRDLRLRPGPSGAEGRHVPGQSRRDGGPRRPDRLGQVELHGAGPPLLRRAGGRGARGRARRAGPDPGARSGARSRWCCRSRSCSPARCSTTSATTRPTRPATR